MVRRIGVRSFAFFASVLNAAVQVQSHLIGTNSGQVGVNAEYDYVIVGGGTAGLTVAQRLVSAGSSVAVIEAGGFYEMDNSNISQIPAFVTRFAGQSPADFQPLIDWEFHTAPQKQLNGRVVRYAQGKTLGGGSARNWLAYHRPTKGSLKQWADKVGDQSYTYENTLKYYKKSVEFTPPNTAKRNSPISFKFDGSAFAKGGPLKVSYTNFVLPISQAVVKAYTAIGLKPVDGFNSGGLIGWAPMTLTLDPKDQTRSSSETSFLREGIKKPTFVVYSYTVATKIIFSGKKASGVAVERSDIKFNLSAKKSVIISAGTFNTPKLLMLSGIGNAATLGRLGIPITSSLPGVGQNMRDHPFFGAQYRVKVSTHTQLANPGFLNQATADFLEDQNGPLANVGGEFIAFEKIPAKLRGSFSSSTNSALAKFPADWPDVEYIPFAAPTLQPPTDTSDYATFTVSMAATVSLGNVTISSADPHAAPVISPNWLHDKTDQEVAIAAFKRAREQAKESGITVGGEVFPGTAVVSDSQILDAIKASLGPTFHASGTCAMGKQSDPNAVVDTRGRVFGVQNLRIIDASVFPLLPPGHPQATVYMLAEKLAEDLIAG